MEGCGARLSAGAGLIVFAVGLALTYMSYRNGASAQQNAIFVGVMVAGLIIMLASTMQPSVTTYTGGRKSRMIDVTSYVSPPGQMRKGYCWLCGRRVRKKSRICPACGATQMNVAPDDERLSTAPTIQRKPERSFMTEDDLPVPGKQPSSGMGITPRRVAPRYVPGASGQMPAFPPDPAFDRKPEPSSWRMPEKPPRSGLPIRPPTEIRRPAKRQSRPLFRRRQPSAWDDAGEDW